MELKDLNDAERLVIEKLRILKDGASFDLLPEAIAECLDILVQRAIRYNKSRTAYDNTFTHGDVSMMEAALRPMMRAEEIVSDGNGGFRRWVPKDEMGDVLHDATNYPLMWMVNRLYRERVGAQG